MAFVNRTRRAWRRFSAFVMPTYRPERYYMRGPGPACMKRAASEGMDLSTAMAGSIR